MWHFRGHNATSQWCFLLRRWLKVIHKYCEHTSSVGWHLLHISPVNDVTVSGFTTTVAALDEAEHSPWRQQLLLNINYYWLCHHRGHFAAASVQLNRHSCSSPHTPAFCVCFSANVGTSYITAVGYVVERCNKMRSNKASQDHTTNCGEHQNYMFPEVRLIRLLPSRYHVPFTMHSWSLN